MAEYCCSIGVWLVRVIRIRDSVKTAFYDMCGVYVGLNVLSQPAVLPFKTLHPLEPSLKS